MDITKINNYVGYDKYFSQFNDDNFYSQIRMNNVAICNDLFRYILNNYYGQNICNDENRDTFCIKLFNVSCLYSIYYDINHTICLIFSFNNWHFSFRFHLINKLANFFISNHKNIVRMLKECYKTKNYEKTNLIYNVAKEMNMNIFVDTDRHYFNFYSI